jgi:hypothetical protein
MSSPMILSRQQIEPILNARQAGEQFPRRSTWD